MIKIIQSPENFTGKLHSIYYLHDMLFLAGGISNCPNWQKEIIDKFSNYTRDTDLYIFNPRREGDLASTGEETKNQILWEHKYLRYSKYLLFWFPEETVCPITLFELGKYAYFHSCFKNRVFVGIHPNYSRRFDLEIQLPLIIPDIKIHYSLDDLFDAVKEQLKLKEKEK